MKKVNDIEYLTNEEMCQKFGISRSTWKRWRRRYRVEYVAIGRQLLYPQTEVDRIIKEAKTRG